MEACGRSIPKELAWMIFDYFDYSIRTMKLMRSPHEYAKSKQLNGAFRIKIKMRREPRNTALQLIRFFANKFERGRSMTGWDTNGVDRESIVLMGIASGIDMISLGPLRINQVTLKNIGLYPEAAANFLRGLEVDRLCVEDKRFEIDYGEWILDWIRNCGVVRFKIDVRNPQIANPRKYLLDLCQLVDHLYINQQRITSASVYGSYLFGMHNENWADLIKEMFEKRVSSVKIDNPYYTMFNTVEELIDLARTLCNTGSKNVLKTYSCCEISNQQININGHLVKVSREWYGDHCAWFTIIHRSRRKEKF